MPRLPSSYSAGDGSMTPITGPSATPSSPQARSPASSAPVTPTTPTTPTRWKRKSQSSIRSERAKQLQKEEEDEEPSYWTLPRREQIFYLVVCRITEPLAYASISPYIYYMIRDFGYSDPSKISAYVTLITTSFSFGQALTAVWWGRFADKYGRKPALMLGLLGTAISIIIFGTSQNILWAIAGRMMSGLLNGNVGVMRTMVAEFIGDKKQYQTRAFAILPITMNVGTVVGPMIGGMLADPANSYPSWFGDSEFLKRYPYILPNLFPLPFILTGLICTFLFIEETLEGSGAILPKDKDLGLSWGQSIKARFFKSRSHSYEPVDQSTNTAEDDDELSLSELEEEEIEEDGPLLHPSAIPREGDSSNAEEPTVKPDELADAPVDRSLKAILTKPVRVTLLAYIILMLHCPTFMQLLPLFLSTPRMGEDFHKSPFHFNGGLGLKSAEIGIIVSILGVVGVSLQLMVYPRLAAYLGNARLHKMALLVFPPCYFLIPYLSFIPAKPEFLGMLVTAPMAAIVILGRTFAIPPMTILITNASPSRKVLGTVHGVTHSVTSIARCIGPFILGNVYSLGVKWNMISLAWWIMGVIVVLENFVAANLQEWGQNDPVPTA